jgi:dolichol-phosphate mannosyltransferase
VELDPLTSQFSIIIATNLSDPLILDLIRSIKDAIPKNISAEIVLVENMANSTGSDEKWSERKRSIRNKIKELEKMQGIKHNLFIKLVRKLIPKGKVFAILEGVKSANGENVIIMNDDFTHPPEVLPSMMELIMKKQGCMVVASRYAEGGSVVGRTAIRRLLGRGAAGVARYGLKVKNVKDPVSAFIGFPRRVLETIPVDGNAYSLSLEILVKSKGLEVQEIPYCFKENPLSEQKVIPSSARYVRSIIHLYRYGPKLAENGDDDVRYRRSVKFLSKAGRFYTVGASGLLVNYLVSTIISNGAISHLWYMHGTLIGILVSIITNFFLNKAWTFEDRDFSLGRTTKQFSLFLLISSFGAAIQLGFVYLFVESGLNYALSLLCAVAIASASNFLLNKKLTFKDRLWG